jgi:hypothetical protein
MGFAALVVPSKTGSVQMDIVYRVLFQDDVVTAHKGFTVFRIATATPTSRGGSTDVTADLEPTALPAPVHGATSATAPVTFTLPVYVGPGETMALAIYAGEPPLTYECNGPFYVPPTVTSTILVQSVSLR